MFAWELYAYIFQYVNYCVKFQLLYSREKSWFKIAYECAEKTTIPFNNSMRIEKDNNRHEVKWFMKYKLKSKILQYIEDFQLFQF